MKKRVVVLGSTGSIGRQTLDILRSKKDMFETLALAAGSNEVLLKEQISEFRPAYAGLAQEANSVLCGEKWIQTGASMMENLASLPQADIVVIGISGIAALPPLLAALYAGKTVALANKESIVCGHMLVEEALKTPGAKILPVDSEQSAIFQCLEQNGKDRAGLHSVILTASGGSFWRMSREDLKQITPQQASYHPVWKMGKKITVDSATLFNKGLEIIEAGYLFQLKKNQIRVLVHPQSIIHSMVEYVDGTVLAQLGVPDMRLAIQYALTYPERKLGATNRLSLAQIGSLTFHDPKELPFRSLDLAYAAYEEGNVLPVVYNGANEAAVEMFLAGRIGFCDIECVVAEAMEKYAGMPAVHSLQEILALDSAAKRFVKEWAKN